MNLFTPITSETRLDYNGQPYKVVVIGKKTDYAKLWADFKARFHNQVARGPGTFDAERANQYFENEKQLTDENRIS